MHRGHIRLAIVAIVTGTSAFAVFVICSLMAWHIFPYPECADKLQRQMVWLNHVVGEKIGQCVLFAVVGFVAARLHRPSWKLGIVTAILAVLVFHFISVAVYIVRFGFGAYRIYNTFWGTLQVNIPIALSFGFFAVWRQYRRERCCLAMRSSGPPPADAADRH